MDFIQQTLLPTLKNVYASQQTPPTTMNEFANDLKNLSDANRMLRSGARVRDFRMGEVQKPFEMEGTLDYPPSKSDAFALNIMHRDLGASPPDMRKVGQYDVNTINNYLSQFNAAAYMKHMEPYRGLTFEYPNWYQQLKRSNDPTEREFAKSFELFMQNAQFQRMMDVANFKRPDTPAKDAGWFERKRDWCGKNPVKCIFMAGFGASIIGSELLDCIGDMSGGDFVNAQCDNAARRQCEANCFDKFDSPAYWDEAGGGVQAFKLEDGDGGMANTQWNDIMRVDLKAGWDAQEDQELFCTYENLESWSRTQGTSAGDQGATCNDYCEAKCADAYPDRGWLSMFPNMGRNAMETAVDGATEVTKGVFDGLFGDNFFEGLLFIVVLVVGLYVYKNFFK